MDRDFPQRQLTKKQNMKLKHILALVFLTIIPCSLTAQEIFPQKSTLQKDAQQLDEGILSVAEALNHSATILNIEHDKIWSLPDDRLLALLNADIPRIIAISAAKDAAATQINALLVQLNLPQYTLRAPVGFGRADVKFDPKTNLFVIVPPVKEPEP